MAGLNWHSYTVRTSLHTQPEKLAATGYSQQQRVFTPAQVAHIIDELGEP